MGDFYLQAFQSWEKYKYSSQVFPEAESASDGLWHRERRALIFSNTECVGYLTSHTQLLILWERTYDLSFLSDKSKKSNHLQMPSQHCANPALLDYTL